MKKLLSLLLALSLLFSLIGCTPAVDTQLQATSTDSGETQPLDTEKIIIPGLVGQKIEELPETEDYTVQESHRMYSTQEAGVILGQAPVEGAEADLGATIYVIVSMGSQTGSDETAPEITEPDATRPQLTEPDLPVQTDPLETTQKPIETQPKPEPTQPPATEPEQTDPPETDPPATEPESYLDPNGSYTTKDDVALYIHLYGRLPNNFVTKNKAEDLYGWDGGSLSRYGMCIGGDRFYNNEGRLPSGYTYYECDIDTLYSSKRGAKRLVFTYSGIIYYTSDHYKTFVRLY